MKRAFFTIVFSSIYFILSAQFSSQEVIVSSGDFFSSASGSLAWSLGEILTETYQQPNNSLTQGFHQSETGPVTAIDKSKEIVMSIYPNPTKDLVNVKMGQNGNYQFTLFDLQGRILIDTEVRTTETDIVYEINLKDFAAVIYLLKIVNTNTGEISFFRIGKI